MALSATVMASLIVTNLKTLNPEIALQPGAEAKLTEQWEQICSAMVSHITTAAVVNTNDTITSNGATGPGPPGGPLPIVGLSGTGTGVGTIS